MLIYLLMFWRSSGVPTCQGGRLVQWVWEKEKKKKNPALCSFCQLSWSLSEMPLQAIIGMFLLFVDGYNNSHFSPLTEFYSKVLVKLRPSLNIWSESESWPFEQLQSSYFFIIKYVHANSIYKLRNDWNWIVGTCTLRAALLAALELFRVLSGLYPHEVCHYVSPWRHSFNYWTKCFFSRNDPVMPNK